MNKDEIRSKIVSLREQMELIENKHYKASDDFQQYKNLNRQVDDLFRQLFNE